MSFDGDLYPEAGATSVMTTKGDMVDFDTQRQRLAIGSASDVLTVTAGLPAWVAPSGGATINQHNGSPSSNFTSTSTTYVDVTSLTITASGSSGAIFCTVDLVWNVNGAANFMWQFVDAGVAIGGRSRVEQDRANTPYTNCSSYLTTPDTQVIKIQAKVDANQMAIYGDSPNEWSNLWALEVA